MRNKEAFTNIDYCSFAEKFLSIKVEDAVMDTDGTRTGQFALVNQPPSYTYV